METRYIRQQPLGGPAGWAAVEAEPVHPAGYEHLDLFVHQALNMYGDPRHYTWRVTDGLTGYAAGEGETAEQAIRDFEERMARCGITAFLELQASAFAAVGGEDWSRAEREVAELSVA